MFFRPGRPSRRDRGRGVGGSILGPHRDGLVLGLGQPKATELGPGACDHAARERACVQLEALEQRLGPHSLKLGLWHVDEEDVLLAGQADGAVTAELSDARNVMEVLPGRREAVGRSR